jgi:hypothetical protein
VWILYLLDYWWTTCWLYNAVQWSGKEKHGVLHSKNCTRSMYRSFGSSWSPGISSRAGAYASVHVTTILRSEMPWFSQLHSDILWRLKLEIRKLSEIPSQRLYSVSALIKGLWLGLGLPSLKLYSVSALIKGLWLGLGLPSLKLYSVSALIKGLCDLLQVLHS